MKYFIRQYPIWSFLILNYIISWTFLYPCYQLILKNDEIPPLAFIGMIGAYGPTIAAILIQWNVDRQKVKSLIKSVIQVKYSLWIYALVILFPLLSYAVAHLGASLVQSEKIELNLIQGTTGILFWVAASLPFGPMGEELGWRGYMLPNLLKKYSPIKSSILVGLAWGFWHLASFTFPGAAIPVFMPVTLWSIGLYFLNTIALSTFFTYVYLRAGGSVFVAILLHALFNASSNIIVDFFGATDNYLVLLSAYIFNIILVGITGLFLLNKRNTKV